MAGSVSTVYIANAYPGDVYVKVDADRIKVLYIHIFLLYSLNTTIKLKLEKLE